jgi:hypothetical protein
MYKALDEACEWYRRSLYKQLINRESDNDIRLRPSLLGKSAIDVVAHKFYPELYMDRITDDRFWQLLHDGDTFECDYRVHMELLGINIIQSQAECDWWGVKGSADFVVDIDGKRVLLELKTSNEGFFKSIMKMQRDDDRVFKYGDKYAKSHKYLLTKYTDYRGHLTQASVYADALSCDEAVIILKNKETSEVVLYNLTRKEREDALSRASSLVSAWDSCNNWLDVYHYVGIPEPRKEIKDGTHTGRYLVNPSLYGCPIIPLVYEWGLDKDKVTIQGYRIPEEVVDDLSVKLIKHYEEIGIYTYGTEQIPELLSEWSFYQSVRKESS